MDIILVHGLGKTKGFYVFQKIMLVKCKIIIGGFWRSLKWLYFHAGPALPNMTYYCTGTGPFNVLRVVPKTGVRVDCSWWEGDGRLVSWRVTVEKKSHPWPPPGSRTQKSLKHTFQPFGYNYTTNNWTLIFREPKTKYNSYLSSLLMVIPCSQGCNYLL